MPNMKNLRIAAPYYKPYWIPFTAGLLIVLASSAITSVIPWVLRRAIDAIGAGAPMSTIWKLSGIIVLAAIVGGAFRYGMRELMNGVSRWMEYDLRNDLFKHLETLDAAYFAQTRTGDIMARLTNDLSAVRMAVGPAVMYLANTITGGLFALYFMLRIDVKLTLLALLPTLFLPVLTIKMGKAIHDRFEAVQEHFSTLTTRAQENLTGARIVRAYRQEAAEVARFGTINDQYLALNMSLVRLWGTLNPLFAFFGGLGAVIVLGVGGALTIKGTITVVSFVAFGMYLTMLTWPMIALGWVVNLFQRGDASMGRLAEILVVRPTINGDEPRQHLPPTKTGRTIEFRNVGFHYPSTTPGEPRWVLRNVSFTVPAGATFGVVGATGSGKSALIDLIPRMYDPQESLLFSDTIGSNLSYGTSGITQTGEWAAGIAQLHQTIDQFPGRYETVLGERGINLSGGQKQRASLARALAKKPSIVLLDDALSAVDTHTEAEILRALREALAGRTALIASHRISAIRDASWIILLDHGSLLEHDDPRGIAYRAYAVRRDERRSPRQGFAQRPENLRFGVRVDSRQRVIEQHDTRLLCERSRERGALLLTTGQIDSALAGDRLVAAGKLVDRLMELRNARRPFPGLCNPARSVREVRSDGVAEEKAFLRHESDVLPQLRRHDVLRRNAVDENLAFLRIVHSRNQVDKRALPASGRADHAERCSRGHGEADVAQDPARLARGGRRIVKPDVPKLDGAARFGGRQMLTRLITVDGRANHEDLSQTPHRRIAALK